MSIYNILAVFCSFAFSALLAPVIIPLLRRLKVGQTEREELKSHQNKAGTPTMGGFIFIIPIIVTSLVYIGKYPRLLPILGVVSGFALIGFCDDYLKVVKRHKDGLLPKQKMLLQILVTAAFGVYLWMDQGLKAFDLLIPFSNGP